MLSAAARRIVVLILAGHLFLGFALAAILPPWEGFDEPGHVSSIQQIADRGEIPRIPSARISTLFDEYIQIAPFRYDGAPPYNASSRFTYVTFFAAGHDVKRAAERAVHGSGGLPRDFAPGRLPNYIAQHPPLYYALMAPLYRATATVGLAAQLLALRAASFLLAWLALVIAVGIVNRHIASTRGSAPAAVLAAAWPVFVPSWYLSMARVGNDSLVALLVSVLWLQLAARGCGTIRDGLRTGIILAAGALTKAFFIPIAAGVVGWSVIRARDEAPGRRLASLLPVAVAVALMAGASAPWYLGPSAVGVAGSESAQLAAAGGLLAALRANFSVGGWLEGIAPFAGSAMWSSTWSYARPAHFWFAPLVAGGIALAGLYMAAVRRHGGKDAGALPLWWLGLLLAGFAWHMLVHVAISGSGRGIGGFYLSVLAGPLAGATAIGLVRAWPRRAVRIAAAGAAAYSGIFAAVAAWAQLLLFSGQITKGADRVYAPAGALAPWLGVPDAIDRLQTLAFPGASAALLAAGLTCFVFAAPAGCRVLFGPQPLIPAAVA